MKKLMRKFKNIVEYNKLMPLKLVTCNIEYTSYFTVIYSLFSNI